MKRVTGTITLVNSLHADAWTETLVGLLFLIDKIEHIGNKGDSCNATYLTRLTIISSSYLAEQVFWKASRQYVDKLLAGNQKDVSKQLLKRLSKKYVDPNSSKQVGISRAMEEWPKTLIGKPLELGKEPLQSLQLVMRKRNDIIHNIRDLTRYEKAPEVARSAFYTAVEASKSLWDHFFSGGIFPL